MADLGKIQKNVLSIIRENPEAANDDSVLVAAYWRKFCDWDDRKSLEDNIRKATRAGTITRRRRELHEAGLITYERKVDQEREAAFVNERDKASSMKAVPWL